MRKKLTAYNRTSRHVGGEYKYEKYEKKIYHPLHYFDINSNEHSVAYLFKNTIEITFVLCFFFSVCCVVLIFSSCFNSFG